MSDREKPSSEIIFYRTPDGSTRLEVRLENETVWLTQALMAELFQKDVRTINEHLVNIFDEGELSREATIRKFRIVRAEGNRKVSREIEHYNLDAVIAVGYRVRSVRGTQFRIWATERLHEYIVKGFTLDDDRLKQLGGGTYFEELLARIRDIRSSEKVFWRKVLDIYATSVDYDPRSEVSQLFFATIQNKMHWAAHGHTAAEIVHGRANATKPHMGLTSWQGMRPQKEEVAIAKNYLTEEELTVLNRIVTAYLEFAELQALNRTPMYMKDWAAKMDDFLRMSGRDILEHAGTVSHEEAIRKAELEFEKYRQRQIALPSPIEKDFEEAVKKLPNPRKKK